MTNTLVLSRRLMLVAGCLLASGAAACTQKSKHATDGDTGTAAPATVIDMSATPRAGDSTPAVASPTGQPQQSADTLNARARDPKARPNAGSPVRRP